jgi:hypothetical protein
MGEIKTPNPPAPTREKRDINIRKVAVFGGALLVAICLAGVLTTLVIFKKLAGSDANEGVAPSPMLEAQPLPPEPRLQANPPLDLKKYRAAEEAELGSYGWVDKPNGVVRIPVDRALKLVLERGLPVRPDAQIGAQGNPEAGKSQVPPKTAPGQPAKGR